MGKKQPIKHGKEKLSFVSRLSGKPLIIFLLVSTVILTFLAYLRSLNGHLVLDDTIWIEASRLENVFNQNILRARSVAEISFAVNYLISGINPVSFRITNVIFHIITSGLAFYLSYITLTLPSIKQKYKTLNENEMPLYIALLVAAFFALHPIQTSSVNYITQRMAIMACMFSFSGLIFYIKGALKAGKKSAFFYTLSAASFVLAVFSKENAVMVMIMLPVYDLFFLSSFQWREFKKRFIPLLVLVAALGLIVFSTMSLGGFFSKIFTLLSNPDMPMGKYDWAGIDINWTPIEYILTELRIVTRYILIILFPSPSFMVFDFANAYPVSKGLFDPVTTIFSLFFIASFLFFALRYMKRFFLISFGILWYLVTISLESFIALGLDPYFEHRNYLPGFGLFLILASFLIYKDKITKGGFLKNRQTLIVPAGIFAIMLLLFVLTFIRNGIWAEEDMLWKDAADKAPDNPRALIALSSSSLRKGNFQEAESYIQKADRLHLTNRFKKDILINKASLYKETNRRKEAMEILTGFSLDKTLSIKERSHTYFMIGEILREQGEYSEAKEYLQKAYKIEQNNPFLLTSLGIVSRALGEADKAEDYFKRANKAAPGQFIASLELAELYFMKGELDEAEKFYSTVLSGWSDIPQNIAKKLFLCLGQLKMTKGFNDESKRLFRKAIEIAPDFYPPYIFLGQLFLEENDTERSLSYLEKAASLKGVFIRNDPNTKLLYFYLGRAYLQKGDKNTARGNFAMFISLAKGDERLKKQHDRAKELLMQIME